MEKYLGRRRRKAGQAPWAPWCPCPRVADTHAVVAISTTIMERGIHSPKQLTTDTTCGRHELGTLLLPPPVGWHPLGSPGPPGCCPLLPPHSSSP